MEAIIGTVSCIPDEGLQYLYLVLDPCLTRSMCEVLFLRVAGYPKLAFTSALFFLKVMLDAYLHHRPKDPYWRQQLIVFIILVLCPSFESPLDYLSCPFLAFTLISSATEISSREMSIKMEMKTLKQKVQWHQHNYQEFVATLPSGVLTFKTNSSKGIHIISTNKKLVNCFV